MAQLIDHLNQLEVLGDNWDRRGSAAPSRFAIKTARNMAAVPLGSGGLQLELHAGGADIEIEIDEGGYVTAVSWSKVRT